MAFLPTPPLIPPQRARRTSRTITSSHESYDTILIGSGLSSLSTASLLHHYNPHHSTLILEAHTTPGGAAHTFQRACPDGKITFEVGPHLFSGLRAGDNNPVGQLFQVLGIQPEIVTYDSWGVILGERLVRTEVPGEVLLGEVLSERGRREMRALCEGLKRYGEAAKGLSVACVRGDIGMLKILIPRLGGLLKHLRYVGMLNQPFKRVLDEFVSDETTYNLVNLLCFLLAGVGVDRIPTAEVAFMFSEWGEGSLQRPVGGGWGVVKALLGYVKTAGGRVRTNARVERILVENGCARGVVLADGEVIRGERVISSVSSIDHSSLLDQETRGLDLCESFLHLHVAFKAGAGGGVDRAGGRLEANYVVVDDIFKGVEDDGNVVLVSIPSAIDDVGPEDWVVLHAYTPATEAYQPWEGLAPGTPEYEAYKTARGELLWRAVGKIFGEDLRNRGGGVRLLGTPRTHERFLYRGRGSYGCRVDARKGPMGGLRFGWDTGVDGLYRVGDGVFPGVGVPAVVAGAWMVANCCVGVERHEQVLSELGV